MLGAQRDRWQREGIAKAKAEGKYKGRKPTARAKEAEVLRLVSEGAGGTEIAKRLNVGRASVYRVLKAHTSSKLQAAGTGPRQLSNGGKAAEAVHILLID
jgi:DNA invertase Pin-like site-specific DNA recombinase